MVLCPGRRNRRRSRRRSRRDKKGLEDVGPYLIKGLEEPADQLSRIALMTPWESLRRAIVQCRAEGLDRDGNAIPFFVLSHPESQKGAEGRGIRTECRGKRKRMRRRESGRATEREEITGETRRTDEALHFSDAPDELLHHSVTATHLIVRTLRQITAPGKELGKGTGADRREPGNQIRDGKAP